MGNTASAIDMLPTSFRNATGESSGPLMDNVAVMEKSEYFSPRIEAMMQSRSQFASDIEHEIEFSKSHWSQVSGSAALSQEDQEEEDRQNMKFFEELCTDPEMMHPEFGNFFKMGDFFEGCGPFKLVQKIAEGGQAEIFEFADVNGKVYEMALLKVFKRGSLLQLRQQWPLGVLRDEVPQCLVGGTMLEDGKFAFIMLKCWGDLRKLIDQTMIKKNNQHPPFPCEWDGKIVDALWIMGEIACGMDKLHAKGIFHRDLKSSNILLFREKRLFLGDFECSIGVVGTMFWRAPEILLALKEGDPIIFTEKADVYSYGMTCFEIVTGRLPFEGELEPCRDSYDLVIKGKRPKLPSSLDNRIKNLITKCWDSNPKKRPTFLEIIEIIKVLKTIEIF